MEYEYEKSRLSVAFSEKCPISGGLANVAVGGFSPRAN